MQFTVTKLPDNMYVLYVEGGGFPRCILSEFEFVDDKRPVVGDHEPFAGISEDKDETYTSAAVCLVLECVIANIQPELSGSRSRLLVALGQP